MRATGYSATDAIIINPADLLSDKKCGLSEPILACDKEVDYRPGSRLPSDIQVLHAQLQATRILRRTAELVNSAITFAEGLASVQAYLAQTFRWDSLGYRLFAEADAPVFLPKDDVANAKLSRSFILLQIVEDAQLLAILAFDSLASGVTLSQRMILAEIADQLLVLAKRESQQQDYFHHAMECLHEGQLAGMAEIAQSLSHELSQPLAATAAYSGAMQRFIKSMKIDDAILVYLADRLQEQVDRAGGILQSAKNLMLQQASSVGAVEVAKNLPSLIQYVQQLWEQDAVHLDVHIATGLPRVRGSESQLAQIMLGLLKNAFRQATVTGGHVSVAVLPVGEEIRISVSYDSGSFEPLNFDAGLGLLYAYTDSDLRGLTISRSLTELLGGRFWCQRVRDLTTLIVALPIAR